MELSIILAWMKNNNDLSGWAQAIGAFVALLIAIGIPAWQRRQQRNDSRLEALNLDVVLGRGVFFVLTDAYLWIRDIEQKTYMPRSEAKTDFIFHDLIERLLLWEGRETDGHRVVALYLTRGALTRTQNKLTWSLLQHTPIKGEELELLRSDNEIVCAQKDFVQRILERSVYLETIRKLSVLRRPSFWWKYRKNFRSWAAPAPSMPRREA